MWHLKVIVIGRVQGVGFRYFVLSIAKKLGIVGTVKNLYDDSLEVIAEGNKKKLEVFLTYLKKGPALSNVENVIVDWNENLENFKEFFIC